MCDLGPVATPHQGREHKHYSPGTNVDYIHALSFCAAALTCVWTHPASHGEKHVPHWDLSFVAFKTCTFNSLHDAKDAQLWKTCITVALKEKTGAIIHQLNELKFWSEEQIRDSLSFQQIRMHALLITTHFSIVHCDSGAEQQMKQIIIQHFTERLVWETMRDSGFVVLN